MFTRLRSSSIHSILIFKRTKTSTKYEQIEELQEYMHGRKNTERKDSVTPQILLDRKNHYERIIQCPINKNVLQLVDQMGLGVRKRRNLRASSFMSFESVTGAGGWATHLSSALGNWPVFDRILPEIAFAGHSNSGKSTLVNAISGLSPSLGPAKVSPRAGWTTRICFFQLGRKPPKLILADLPGYGHAVVHNKNMITLWYTIFIGLLNSRVYMY